MLMRVTSSWISRLKSLTYFEKQGVQVPATYSNGLVSVAASRLPLGAGC